MPMIFVVTREHYSMTMLLRFSCREMREERKQASRFRHNTHHHARHNAG